MRTLYPVIVILALAGSATMLSMGGISHVTNDDPGDSFDSVSDFENASNQSAVAPDGNLEGSASTQGDGSIIGLIISGAENVVDLASMIVHVPTLLIRLGFPSWMAETLGRAAQIIVGIGVIEFASNRQWT